MSSAILAVPSPAVSARAVMGEVFGYGEFRGAQEEIIDHVAGGGDALVLMPTGGGKSLCYQVPAIVRHRAGQGVAVVVSPLIALMHDQVGALEEAGVHAAFLNSTLESDEARQIERELLAGRLVMLYAAPERILTPRFVAMLADIVRHATFPQDELVREREVLLQEVAEVEDDPITVAYQLFDHACWAEHPAAQPVIGQRRVIERCTREQLAAHVRQHYTGANIVIAAAGAIDPTAVLQATETAFGDMPRGQPNELPAAVYAGGTRVKRMDVGRQMHLVMGYPIAGRAEADAAVEVAAAVLGDGMSSPLLAELREKRGLVYHAACNADRFEFGGQLAIEASFAPEHLDTVLAQVAQLMRGQAERVETVDLERARNQVIVRLLRHDERVTQRLEDAALDLFALQRVRRVAERLARVREVSGSQVRTAFQRMLDAGASVAITGSVGRGVSRRVEAALALNPPRRRASRG
jgi:predicted Zn-dependent peptidase